MKGDEDYAVMLRMPGFDELIDRHAPIDWRRRFGLEDALELQVALALQKHSMTVAAFDLRKSTRMTRDSANEGAVINAITELVDAAWWMIRLTGGWFDKFTGDGFIAYWMHGPIAGEGWEVWERDDGKPSAGLASMMGMTELLRRHFNEETRPILQKYAANWPEGTGLSVGIDAGRGIQTVIGGDFTPIGPAIIGAVRMEEAAGKDEILVNTNLGHRLASQVEGGVWGDLLTIEQDVRTTKEYPSLEDGLTVYKLVVSDPLALMDLSGEQLPEVSFDPSAPEQG